MKKIISLITIIILTICISGCGLINDDVYLVLTSDVHGEVNNGIGYAGLKSYVKSLKKSYSYVTLIDGGDFSTDGTIAKKSEGSDIIDIMNDVGYDIVTLGNHEFDYGLDRLSENLSKAKFNIVDCNLKYIGSGKDPFSKVKPYVIKKYGNKKIAFVGILTPVTYNYDKESYTECLEDGELAYDLYHNPYESDGGDALFAKVQETVDEARTKADIVVAVTHLGINTKSVMNVQSLIAFTRGIDIVFDSHGHTTFDGEYWPNIDGEDVFLFAVGEHLDRAGLLTIKKDGTYQAEYVDNIEERDSSLQSKIDELLDKYE